MGLIQLLKLDLGDTEVKRALALLLVWPMSFVLFGGYAEPLLMCFTIWSIWFARNDRWWLAALFGLLACLSRAVGMVVVAPLVWIAWRQRPLRYAPLLLALSGPVLFPVWLRWVAWGCPPPRIKILAHHHGLALDDARGCLQLLRR